MNISSRYNYAVQNTYDNIILSGSISIDRIMNFSGHYKDMIQPDKLHVLSLSILVDKLTNSRGGTAANIAYNLALLGEKPILLGSVGDDAKSYIQDLQSMGIDTQYVHTSELPTPTFTVMTDLDNNQIGGFYPGAMSDISNLSLSHWYKTKSLVVISANDPLGMDQLVSECIKHNLDYAYDVGQQVTNISVAQLKLGISRAKILFVNDYEHGSILARTGYSERQLREQIPVIVTTLGEGGTKITGSSLKKPILVKSISKINVVDPTGAGDAYRSGFLYGYKRGYDLEVCAQLGSLTAIYAIETHGTQNHTFDFAEIEQKLYSNYGTKI